MRRRSSGLIGLNSLTSRAVDTGCQRESVWVWCSVVSRRNSLNGSSGRLADCVPMSRGNAKVYLGSCVLPYCQHTGNKVIFGGAHTLQPANLVPANRPSCSDECSPHPISLVFSPSSPVPHSSLVCDFTPSCRSRTTLPDTSHHHAAAVRPPF